MSRSLGRQSHAPEVPGAMVDTVLRGVFERDDEYKRCARKRDDASLVDYHFVSSLDAHLPHEVFDRIRWGGQLVFVSRDRAEVEAIAAKYRDRRGFIIEREPASVGSRVLGFREHAGGVGDEVGAIHAEQMRDERLRVHPADRVAGQLDGGLEGQHLTGSRPGSRAARPGARPRAPR